MNSKILFLSIIVCFATMTISAQEKSEKRDYYGVIGLEYSNLKSYDLDGGKRGMYGFSMAALRDKRIGLSFTATTNAGIVDWEWHSLMFRVGPNYSYFLSDNVILHAPFRAVIMESNYQDVGDIGKEGIYDSKWGWGLDLTPTISLKLWKISLGVGLNLMWLEGADKINTSISASLGFCF